MKIIAKIILLPALLCASQAYGQDVSVTAAVDKDRLGVNEMLNLQVSVSGESQNLPKPAGDSLNNFHIRSSGTSQSVSIVNGKVSSTVTYNYVLAPKSAGTFDLGPFSVTVNGQTFSSGSAKIQVSGQAQASNSAPKQAQSQNYSSEPQNASAGAFVTTGVSNRSPFVGEEVILNFKFIHRVRVYGDSQYKPPETIGFIKEDLPPQLNYQTEINGQQYMVSELRTALFPTSAGKHIIGPAELAAALEGGTRNDPFGDDFFRQFFSSGQKQLLKSKPIELNVKPLPESGKPATFEGAVGTFEIASKIDKTECVQNEPVTLTVTVSGTGNIKSINEPKWPSGQDFKFYDTVSSVNQKADNYRIKGSKTFQKVLIPQRSGELVISPVEFSYFDPQKQAYKTLKTKEVKLKVKANGSYSAAGAQFQQQSSVKEFNRDITFIKASACPIKADKLFIINGFAVKILFAFPLFLYAGLVFYLKKQEHLSKHRAFYRYTAALRKARRELNEAVKKFKKNSDNASYIGSLSNILVNFISDKLNRSGSGLTIKEIIDEFTASGVDAATIEQTKKILEEMDFYRFAPTTAKEISGLDSKAAELMNRLDKELKK